MLPHLPPLAFHFWQCSIFIYFLLSLFILVSAHFLSFLIFLFPLCSFPRPSLLPSFSIYLFHIFPPCISIPLSGEVLGKNLYFFRFYTFSKKITQNLIILSTSPPCRCRILPDTRENIMKKKDFLSPYNGKPVLKEEINRYMNPIQKFLKALNDTLDIPMDLEGKLHMALKHALLENPQNTLKRLPQDTYDIIAMCKQDHLNYHVRIEINQDDKSSIALFVYTPATKQLYLKCFYQKDAVSRVFLKKEISGHPCGQIIVHDKLDYELHTGWKILQSGYLSAKFANISGMPEFAKVHDIVDQICFMASLSRKIQEDMLLTSKQYRFESPAAIIANGSLQPAYNKPSIYARISNNSQPHSQTCKLMRRIYGNSPSIYQMQMILTRHSSLDEYLKDALRRTAKDPDLYHILKKILLTKAEEHLASEDHIYYNREHFNRLIGVLNHGGNPWFKLTRIYTTRFFTIHSLDQILVDNFKI